MFPTGGTDVGAGMGGKRWEHPWLTDADPPRLPYPTASAHPAATAIDMTITAKSRSLYRSKQGQREAGPGSDTSAGCTG